MESRIILAADELTFGECLGLAAAIGNRVYAVKIHNIFDRYGPKVISELRDAGATRVWVDLKLHDIPNTVRLRAQEIANASADILTVHASGGVDMMKAAVDSGITIFAITVLTSLSEEQAHLTYGKPTKATALYLASLAKAAGVHGVVCSPKEVGVLKRPELAGMNLVVPGIRSAGKDVGDQQRVDTPAAAVAAGASHLVIGRQITKAEDMVGALSQIEAEIAGMSGGGGGA